MSFSNKQYHFYHTFINLFVTGNTLRCGWKFEQVIFLEKFPRNVVMFLQQFIRIWTWSLPITIRYKQHTRFRSFFTSDKRVFSFHENTLNTCKEIDRHSIQILRKYVSWIHYSSYIAFFFTFFKYKINFGKSISLYNAV